MIRLAIILGSFSGFCVVFFGAGAAIAANDGADVRSYTNLIGCGVHIGLGLYWLFEYLDATNAKRTAA